jgi:hypothetical protein
MLLAVAIPGAIAPPAFAQAADPDVAAVRNAVERFLSDAGNRELDKLPAHFTPKATLIVVRQRDGAWTPTYQTFEEYLAQLKTQKTVTKFREPLARVTVNVESGNLAMLRADFTIVIDDKIQSHGVDYFTLVKDAGTWKIASLAYTSIPGPPPSR